MSDQEPEDFSERLALAIRLEGITQNKLEQVAGFAGRGYVSRLLKGSRGKRPSHDVATRLAKVLHVRVEWLANGEGPMRAAYEDVGPREKAIQAAREHEVLPETFAELDVRFPAESHQDEPALWWLERLIELNKEVRLRLAEQKATERMQSLARKVNDHRKNPPREKSQPPASVRTGTHGRHK
jgi:transcriptional regulator with XRE-family HTH domain